MNIVTTIALAILALSAVLMLLRVLRGPTTAERIVALDATLVVVVCGIVVAAARTGEGVFLDLAVVTSLLAFAGTITVARFIERRGS